MTGNVAALKNLYRELGGSYADVENLTTIVDVLNAISQMYGGRTDATINPDAINNIADVAGDASRDIDQMGGVIERTINSVIIPDSVTTIGENAFANCNALESVIIPDSVTTIGHYAFANCNALESVIIPDSVTTIGEGAFNVCRALKSVIIPDSVTTIAREAFVGTALESVIIPDSVTTIGEYAFYLVTGTIYCRFSAGAVSGAPWGATGTIVYDYQG